MKFRRLSSDTRYLSNFISALFPSWEGSGLDPPFVDVLHINNNNNATSQEPLLFGKPYLGLYKTWTVRSRRLTRRGIQIVLLSWILKWKHFFLPCAIQSIWNGKREQFLQPKVMLLSFYQKRFYQKDYAGTALRIVLDKHVNFVISSGFLILILRFFNITAPSLPAKWNYSVVISRAKEYNQRCAAFRSLCGVLITSYKRWSGGSRYALSCLIKRCSSSNCRPLCSTIDRKMVLAYQTRTVSTFYL